MNTRAGEKRFLSSWQTEEFVVGIAPQTPLQAFIWNVPTPFWRSGSSDGLKFVGISYMKSTYLESGFRLALEYQQNWMYDLDRRFLDNQEFSFDGEDLFPRLAKLGKGKKQEQESLSASQLLLVWSSGLRLYVVCVGGKLTKEVKELSSIYFSVKQRK
ncbi:uncharacterized protein LOC114289173 [Camellia sinensis]|uniref:uncharacterized protein LOC114289173 n=1 Tax=Camellia sinensis TaxID=4442 RepID=UPI001035D2A4|nr:uncharacterized protein LOC114289173 [Camellia sinensis]